MRLIKPLLALVVIALTGTAGGLVASGAPLTREPGVVYRIGTYMTTNSVRTQPVSIFPERELTAYHRPAAEVFDAAVSAARTFGWRIESMERENHQFQAVARTPLWGFKDDIRVRITRTEKASSVLRIRSESRRGMADFGKNTARLIALRQAVEERL